MPTKNQPNELKELLEIAIEQEYNVSDLLIELGKLIQSNEV